MNYNLSLREQIAENIVKIISSLSNPKLRLVTREPFEPSRVAITDFPACLVQLDVEDRTTITMGMGGQGRREGTMVYGIRGYVRGTEIDRLRNELINGIELALDEDRYLGLREAGVIDSQLIHIEVVKRTPPLGEIKLEFQVKYNYLRGNS
jgi:hypothetical protein